MMASSSLNGRHHHLAAKTKGVLNSVYRFLERNTDIIFVREFEAEEGCGTIYGHHPTIDVKLDDLVDVPVFPDYRFWTGHTDGNIIWQARLLNTFTRPLDGNMSPAIYKRISTYQDVSSMSGSLGLGLIDPQKYYDEYPDFFPLIKGQRVRYHDCQLCFMNPKLIAAFCEEAARVVGGNPKRVTSYSVGLGDNWDVCQCPLCLAPIELPGGGVVRMGDRNFRSTQYTLFVNAVSDYLTARFPHVKPIPGQAYLFTAEAPAVPARGGGPQYCPYIKNHKKPVFDDKVNAVWHDKAERFKQASMPIAGLYEYYLCSPRRSSTTPSARWHRRTSTTTAPPQGCLSRCGVRRHGGARRRQGLRHLGHRVLGYVAADVES